MRCPAIDDTATIEPPPERASAGVACRMTDHVPVTFNVSVCSHPGAVDEHERPGSGAPPGVGDDDVQPAVGAAGRRHRSCHVVLGGHVGDDGACRPPISATAASSTSPRRPQIVTVAPSAASRPAQPRPIPVPPPVTRACMPASGPAPSAADLVMRRQYVDPVTDLLAGDPDRFVVTFDRAGTRTPDHPTRPEIQLLSPDFYGPRFEELAAWMRAEAPMYWDDSIGIWGAAAYEDVKRLSRDWKTFCSGQGSRPESSCRR